MKHRDLGELSAELEGISAMVTTLALAVNHALTGEESPSEEIIDSAFYSVEHAIKRVSDDLSALEVEQLQSLRTNEAV